MKNSIILSTLFLFFAFYARKEGNEDSGTHSETKVLFLGREKVFYDGKKWGQVPKKIVNTFFIKETYK